MTSLYQSFSQSALNNRAKIAFIDDTRSITFGELHKRVELTAKALHTSGLRKGDIIIGMSGLCIEIVEVYLACLKLGCIFLPVSSDGGHSVQYSVKFFEPKAIFVTVSMERFVAQFYTDGLLVTINSSTSENQLPAAKHSKNYEQFLMSGENTEAEQVDIKIESNDIAWILPTSGTTGKPKGVMHSHGVLQIAFSNIPPYFVNQTLMITKEMTAISSISFISLAATRGLSIVLTNTTQVEEWYQLIERHKVTFLLCFANGFREIMNSNAHEKYDLSSWKVLAYGGMKFPANVIRTVMNKLNVGLSGAYGMTEAFGIATLGPVEHIKYAQLDQLNACGIPSPHVQVKIKNKEGQDVPVGQRGQVVIKSPTLSVGYYKMPKETSEAYVDGWFYTGDVGVMDQDGLLYLVDRIKDIIITDIGDNVYPNDVENIILKHSNVKECIVFGVPDKHHMAEVVCCAVVLHDSGLNELTKIEIEQLCNDYLSEKQRPRHIHVVNSLPQNYNQKYQAYLLRQQFQDTFAA